MLFLNFLSLIYLIDNKNIEKNALLNQTKLNQDYIYFIANDINVNKIGIVDFRYILKKSNAIKTLGNKFLMFEKTINEKVKLKQSELKFREIKIINNKKKLTENQFQKQIKLLKEEVFKTQKKYKEERSLLNLSFQKIQKRIKDLLAQVIKDVSKKRNINVVFLKENVFLFNNSSIDLTKEVLDLFNEKTKSLTITITLKN